MIKDDKLVGAVLYGDTVDGAWYFKLLRDGRNDRRHPRPADVRRSEPRRRRPPGPEQRPLRWPTTTEVCGCNGVCKGTIVKAIKDKGLFTLDEVRKHTKASRSCGSCTGLVEQLLMVTAGGDYSAAPKQKPMCGCTDRTHEEVRDAIREQQLLTIPDADAVARVAHAQRLRHAAGPALNYYLICDLAGAKRRTTRSRASSTSARTPTSRRTAPTR